jgi:hypothetical protein
MGAQPAKTEQTTLHKHVVKHIVPFFQHILRRFYPTQLGRGAEQHCCSALQRWGEWNAMCLGSNFSPNAIRPPFPFLHLKEEAGGEDL